MITRINNHLTRLGFSPEEIRTITAQAAHETGFFTSDLCVKANNLFGMKKHNRKVEGKEITPYGTYSAYTNIEGSINDLVAWLRMRGAGSQVEDVIKYSYFLKEKKYYEDTTINYTRGMLNAYKTLFPESWHKYNFNKV